MTYLRITRNATRQDDVFADYDLLIHHLGNKGRRLESLFVLVDAGIDVENGGVSSHRIYADAIVSSGVGVAHVEDLQAVRRSDLLCIIFLGSPFKNGMNEGSNE